jgi:hypothetical protein
MNFKNWLLLTEKITHNGETYETVMDLIDELKEEPNTYLSFQKHPQLEIWPGQHKSYNTPVGIYAYPMEYASEKLEKLPFATQQPYIIIFKSTGNIIDNYLTKNQQDSYLNKLKQLYPNLDLNLLQNYQIRSPFSKIWLAVVQILAPNNSSKQNLIFRQLGIDGFDDNGTGTIHPAEQKQAVFFRPQTLQKIQILDNVLHTSLVGKQPLQKYPKNLLTPNIKDKNLFRNYINYLIRSNKISDEDDVYTLLNNSEDKDKMAELIIKNKQNLSNENIKDLFEFSKDKDKIAETLINTNPNLSNENILEIVFYSKNKEKIIKLIINTKSNLSDEIFKYLFKFSKDKDEIAELIINKKPEVSNYNVYEFIRLSNDKEHIAELLGSHNINKLSDDDIKNLIKDSDDKGKIVEVIANNKTNLTDNNVKELIYNFTKVEQIASLFTPEKINNLSDENIKYLIEFTYDSDKIAELLEPDKIKKLSDYNVSILLQYSEEPEKIANILGKKKINEIPNEDIEDLIKNATKPEQMHSILQKYGRIS